MRSPIIGDELRFNENQALELLSVLYTFENSTKCDEISFDPHSFLE